MRSNNIGKLIHIKKLCNDQGHLQMLAIDQRPPIFNLIREKKKAYTYKDVVDFKKTNLFKSISNTPLQY